VLSGKYSGDNPSEGRYQGEGMRQFMPEQSRLERIVGALREVSQETGRPIPQVALAWLRYRDIPVIPIIGTVRSRNSKTTSPA
jgi:aryl-alcohol dehydrogenase-like predicted oxidoreductase